MITEVETIPGYVLNAEPQTVKVNANDVQTLTFENTKIGSLVVKKVDGKTGKTLAGVEFEIEGCRGCDYPTGKYVTDVNGMIRLDDIPVRVLRYRRNQNHRRLSIKRQNRNR